MPFKSRTNILVLAIAMIALVISNGVQAQIQFEIGGNTREIVRFLERQGYTDVEVTKQKISRINGEACRDGIKYVLKLRRNGTLRSKEEIGKCRRTVSLEGAQRILADDGFRRIQLQPQGRGFAGQVCKNGNRFNVSMTRFGDVRRIDPAGRCRREALTPKQIRDRLRDEGYDRIRFTDRELPRYVAEVCRGTERLELVLNRRGRIRDERRIGRCPAPINPRDIANVLNKAGFNRIKVTDNKLPRYVAQACRGANRIEITLNRYGEIRDEKPIGKCRTRIDPRNIANLLSKRGYTRIEIIDNKLVTVSAGLCAEGLTTMNPLPTLLFEALRWLAIAVSLGFPTETATASSNNIKPNGISSSAMGLL